MTFTMNNKELNRNKNGIVSSKTFIRFSIILIFSIAVTFLIATDNSQPSYYSWLPALTIGHAIIIGVCLFVNGKILEKWHTVLAVGIYSVRNLFTPLMMYLGDYHGSFHQLNNDNVRYAVILMLYETLIVFLFLALYGKKKSMIVINNRCSEQKVSSIFLLIIVIIIIFCVVAYMLIPGLRRAYTSLFSSEGIRVTLLKNSETGGGVWQRGIFTLFQILFPIAYTFLCVGLLRFFNKSFKKNGFFKILLSVLTILIPSMFMDGGDGNTIVFIASLFLTALFIGNSAKRSMIRIAVFGGGAIVVYVFMQAMVSTFFYRNITIWQNLSNMFQSYFPGVCNMAGLFNMKSYNKFAQFFYDLYSTIPFRNTLFGLSGFETTPNLYTYDNNAASHIMPCIAHAFYYFNILAPIIPCAMIKKSIDVYQKMRKTTDPYRYVTYSLLFLYLILTPIMYNTVIFLRHYFATFLPMLLICSLNRKNRDLQMVYKHEE